MSNQFEDTDDLDNLLCEENDQFTDIFHQFKLELAMRHDNFYVGTEMGGNPSQFYYFLSHAIKVKESLESVINVSQEDNNVVFELPTKVKFNLKDIRLAFNKFWETCPDKNEFTQEHLTDTSFISNLNHPYSADVHLLLYGLNIANDLVKWLDREAEIGDQIKAFFTKEFDDIKYKFLDEMQLPGDYFVKLKELKKTKNYTHDPMMEVLHKHPVWGKRWDEVEKRQKLIIDNLLSQEDLDKLSKISALPSYITLFIMRSVITIDRLVKHSLDERTEFLTAINKEIKSITKSLENE